MSSNETGLPIIIEFGGGAELLFDKKKKHEVHLPSGQEWSMKRLLAWIKDNLLKERPELFLQGETVRPGILVLVNDADWELLVSYGGVQVKEGNNFTLAQVKNEPDFPWDTLNSYSYYTLGLFALDTNGEGSIRNRQECIWLLGNMRGSELQKNDRRVYVPYTAPKKPGTYVFIVQDESYNRNVIDTHLQYLLRIILHYGKPLEEGNFFTIQP